MVNHESGLLAISGTTADMQQLLKIQIEDKRAAEPVDFFCYQCIKWIGAFTAVLGGLDTLIFSGGIGENLSEIRKRISSGVQFLGIEIDTSKNKKNDEVISNNKSKVVVSDEN
jgi:acetate kinase